jgi:hypothetical protein
MTLRKREVTGNWKRMQMIALHGEARFRRGYGLVRRTTE